MSTQEMNFNPREHLMSLKNNKGASEYLPVQWRLVWFRGDFPEGSIETEVITIDLDRVIETEQFVWNAEKRRSEKVMKTGKGFACFRATIKTGQGGSATATGSESAVDFGDFIEKAETKAIGRALAGLGYGTQFAPDLNEGQRIVDAPVETTAPKNQQTQNPQPQQQQQSQQQQSDPKPQQQEAATIDEATATITERQLASIRKLSEVLGKAEPKNLTTMTILEAKKSIQELTLEYRTKNTKEPEKPAPKQDIPTPMPGWTQLSPADREHFTWSKEVLRSGYTIVCKEAELPIESKNWTVAQYTKYAQQLDKTLAGEPLLADLKVHYNVYHGAAPTSLRGLFSRLLMVDEHGKLKRFTDISYKHALTIYGIFALAMPLHDLGKIYDPNFVLLKEQYGVDHPIALFHLKDGKHNQEVIKDYEAILQQAYKKNPDKIGTMKDKHEELIKTWGLALSA